MKTLPDFRDLRELLHLIDRPHRRHGSHRLPRAARAGVDRQRRGGQRLDQDAPTAVTAADLDTTGFVDCRGVVHHWNEED